MLAGWNSLMQPLVAKYGALKVWETARQHVDFGYPAEWIEDWEEKERLRTILETFV